MSLFFRQTQNITEMQNGPAKTYNLFFNPSSKILVIYYF